MWPPLVKHGDACLRGGGGDLTADSMSTADCTRHTHGARGMSAAGGVQAEQQLRRVCNADDAGHKDVRVRACAMYDWSVRNVRSVRLREGYCTPDFGCEGGGQPGLDDAPWPDNGGGSIHNVNGSNLGGVTSDV